MIVEAAPFVEVHDQDSVRPVRTARNGFNDLVTDVFYGF